MIGGGDVRYVIVAKVYVLNSRGWRIHICIVKHCSLIDERCGMFIVEDKVNCDRGDFYYFNR